MTYDGQSFNLRKSFQKENLMKRSLESGGFRNEPLDFSLHKITVLTSAIHQIPKRVMKVWVVAETFRRKLRIQKVIARSIRLVIYFELKQYEGKKGEKIYHDALIISSIHSQTQNRNCGEHLIHSQLTMWCFSLSRILLGNWRWKRILCEELVGLLGILEELKEVSE